MAAVMGGALTMLFLLSILGDISPWTLVIAAFTDSLISAGFIPLLSRHLKHMAIMLARGICQEPEIIIPDKPA